MNHGTKMGRHGSKLLTVDVVSGQKEGKEKTPSSRGRFRLLRYHTGEIAIPGNTLAGDFASLTELGHVATVDIFVFRVLGVVTKNLDAGWPGRRCAKREQHSSRPRYILQPRRY